MVFFTLFLLFVFPFLQAGPLDNWVSFLAWAIFIVIPLIVGVLLCITVTHEAITKNTAGPSLSQTTSC